MHRGFVKDYRKGIDNPLFKKPLIWHFWGYCLKRANHKDVEIDFNGKPLLLKRGSFLMSLEKTSKETGLSKQNIRTAIKNLVNHKMIENLTQKVTQQATLINVINYGVYQDFTNQPNTATNKELTQSQHSANTGLTLDKNVKNNKELIKNVKKKTFVENSNEYRLAELLSTLMLKNNPDNQISVRAKENNFQLWSDEVRKINEIDKRSFEQIEFLIQWSQKDSFWSTNILSTKKLREKFDTLVLRVKEQKEKHQPQQNNVTTKPESSYDRLMNRAKANQPRDITPTLKAIQ